MENSSQNQDIPPKRCFGLRESLTITTGTVIGVGLFTVGANAAGALGPSVIWASLLALGASVYPALLYGEMGAALPFSGGSYQYASFGLGRAFGMLAGWNFAISMVAVASGEALAFSFYLRTLFEALGLTFPLGDTAAAVLVLCGFLLLGLSGVELTGRMQNAFLFFFWGVAAVWFLSVLPELSFSSFSGPSAALSPSDLLPAAAMVWWCFAGFETCCAMGGEIRCPQINLPRAMKLAPFVVFAVNGLFQWALVALVPADALPELALAAAPYADGMRIAGIAGFPLALLCFGIAFGGDFSTLNAGLAAPARYLQSMAQDGVLPKAFARLHPARRTPAFALLFLGGLAVVLILTGSIPYIASLSLFATLFYYVIGILSAIGLRRKYPSLPRPYRAPWIGFLAPASIVLYLGMMTQLYRNAVLAGLAWNAAGLAAYSLLRRAGETTGLPSLPAADLPDEAERRRMDREYRIWRTAAWSACILVLLLFFLPRFFT